MVVASGVRGQEGGQLKRKAVTSPREGVNHPPSEIGRAGGAGKWMGESGSWVATRNCSCHALGARDSAIVRQPRQAFAT
jgi:hypothetical protein